MSVDIEAELNRFEAEIKAVAKQDSQNDQSSDTYSNQAPSFKQSNDVHDVHDNANGNYNAKPQGQSSGYSGFMPPQIRRHSSQIPHSYGHSQGAVISAEGVMYKKPMTSTENEVDLTKSTKQLPQPQPPPSLVPDKKSVVVPNIQLNIPVSQIESDREKQMMRIKTQVAEPAAKDIYDKKTGKKRKFVRNAAGETWEDPSLQEWDPCDFRLFCGDLGNEVTDELLARTFNKYSSFQKAKVVRDKRSQKTKGFGFVSFKDPTDFVQAMREMNGKYVGNRPIKLRKSNWKDRQIEVVRKKDREKKRLGFR